MFTGEQTTIVPTKHTLQKHTSKTIYAMIYVLYYTVVSSLFLKPFIFYERSLHINIKFHYFYIF